jgi:hypothetical protein
VGALAMLAAGLIFGLTSSAIGTGSLKAFASWNAVSRWDIALAVLSAFFAAVVGAWATAKIAGITRAETAILQGVIAWLVALPLFLLLLSLGAGSAYGGWYGGLVGASTLAPPTTAAPVPTIDSIHRTALASLTGVILGLIGAVIGGWLASGEPMTFAHYRMRNQERRTFP